MGPLGCSNTTAVLMTILTVKGRIKAEQDFKLIVDGSTTLYLLNKAKRDRRGEAKEWIHFKISIMLTALEGANIHAVTKYVFTHRYQYGWPAQPSSWPHPFTKYSKWKEDKDRYFQGPPIAPHFDVDDKIFQSKSSIKVTILFLKPKQSCEKTKMLLSFHLESISRVPSLKREVFYLCLAWN